MAFESGTVVGKYLVRSKLGEDALGEHFQCASRGAEGFEKEVVIKVIRPALARDPRLREVLLQDVRLASRLHHANLVQVLDFKRHEGTFCLVTEHVFGQSLASVQARLAQLTLQMPWELVAQLGVGIAKALAHAHCVRDAQDNQVGLLHRHLGPANIHLARDGSVKVSGFELGRVLLRAATLGAEEPVARPVPPEIAQGAVPDARSDVYLLGVVLWELLAGVALSSSEAVVPPSELRTDVPRELDEIVLTALKPHPGARQPTARELERALASFSNDARAFRADVFFAKVFAEELRPAPTLRASAARPPAPEDGQLDAEGAGLDLSVELPLRPDAEVTASYPVDAEAHEHDAGEPPLARLSAYGAALLAGARQLAKQRRTLLVSAAGGVVLGVALISALFFRSPPPQAAAGPVVAAKPVLVSPPVAAPAPTPSPGPGPRPSKPPEPVAVAPAPAPAKSGARRVPASRPPAPEPKPESAPPEAGAAAAPLVAAAPTAEAPAAASSPEEPPAPSSAPLPPKPEPLAKAVSEHAASAPGMGIVSVSTTTPVEVFLGNRSLGRVREQSKLTLPAGTHDLTFKTARWIADRTVTVEANQETALQLDYPAP